MALHSAIYEASRLFLVVPRSRQLVRTQAGILVVVYRYLLHLCQSPAGLVVSKVGEQAQGLGGYRWCLLARCIQNRKVNNKVC